MPRTSRERNLAMSFFTSKSFGKSGGRCWRCSSLSMSGGHRWYSSTTETDSDSSGSSDKLPEIGQILNTCRRKGWKMGILQSHITVMRASKTEKKWHDLERERETVSTLKATIAQQSTTQITLTTQNTALQAQVSSLQSALSDLGS